MRHILILTNTLGAGGAERVIASLANAWIERGHRVTVATLSAAEGDAYTLHPSVRRVGLAVSGSSQGWRNAVAANLRRVAAIRALLRDTRPDAAIAFLTSCNVLLALARSAHRSCRYIGAERVHPPRFPLGRFWEGLRWATYGLLDTVVAQTRETEHWLRAHTRARAIRVIPNPVVWPLPDRDPVRMPDRVGQPGAPRVLAIGRLNPQKGFDLLIAAFSAVADRFPEWELVILGEGAERETLTRLIASSGCPTRMHLAGEAGNVGAWLSNAALFVLPSRFEGFPNALAEAMAEGCPVISFDCETGPRDLITDGRDGMLVTEITVEALARALIRLMGDAELRSQYAAAAVSVRERYAMARIETLWMEVAAPTASSLVGRSAS